MNIKKIYNDNKTNLIFIGVGIVIGILLMYFMQKPTIKKVPFRVEIEVPVPTIEKEFDTISEPYPVYIKGITKIDSIYYKKWLKLKDSISRNKAYKDVITINEYNTKFEDDILTMNIYSKTRGTLLEIKPNYKTKPRIIPLDTTLNIPIPKYNEFYGGFEVGLPVMNMSTLDIQPILKGNLYLKTKKDNLWSLSFDSEGRGFVGHAWKF
ncbi:MAG: hypothetical protein ACJAVA_000369 [Flavobacteriaceae bacterium]|jgi:hypothetical protein